MLSDYQIDFAVESLSAAVAKEGDQSYYFAVGFEVQREVWRVVVALLNLADRSEVLAAFVVAGQSAVVADFESFVGDRILEAAAFDLCSAAATVNPLVAVQAAKKIVGSLQSAVAAWVAVAGPVQVVGFAWAVAAEAVGAAGLERSELV